ncbi:hypothetical protein H8959_000460 [Pygathrix nigripes]
MVQHALKKSEKALDTLNKAVVIDPKNPLCKFHRASVLFANEKYKSALQELEELKQIVPKESLIYFLIGKVLQEWCLQVPDGTIKDVAYNSNLIAKECKLPSTCSVSHKQM